MTAAEPDRNVPAEENSSDVVAVPLAALKRGQSGRLVEVLGSRLFRRRLMELGLVPGVEVTLENVAPLGDPLELQVRNCHLSIRKGEAEQLLVTEVSGKRVLQVLP